MNHSRSKVIWQEGMFLSPQHFQQQERYLENFCQSLCSLHQSGVAGFSTLSIDAEQLMVGKLFVRQASGLFPDGTPFTLQDDLIRDIHHVAAGTLVYLALPLFHSARVDVTFDEQPAKSTRYSGFYSTINDTVNTENDSVKVALCHLNPCLLLENESIDDYAALPLARIQELNTNGELILDRSFIPRCLDYRVSRYLYEQVQNVRVLMQQRAEQLAQQIGVDVELKSFQTLQLTYMWLQTLNRYGASLKQIEHQAGVSAAQLYRVLVTMAADLSTFSTTSAPDFAVFDEQSIFHSFAPVLSSLHLNLRQASQEKVVALAWDARLFKRRRLLRCQINDRTLFTEGRFILAVSSGIGIQTIQASFLTAAKLCGQQRIAERVRNALSTVTLNPLPGAPIELRSKASTAYFDIDTSDPLWQDMVRTCDVLALHIDKQMPEDTHVDLFVIR